MQYLRSIATWSSPLSPRLYRLGRAGPRPGARGPARPASRHPELLAAVGARSRDRARKPAPAGARQRPRARAVARQGRFGFSLSALRARVDAAVAHVPAG